MEKEIRKNGAEYKISTSRNKDRICDVTLKVKTSDWKKTSGFDELLVHDDFLFRFYATVELGYEEKWEGFGDETEYDFSSVFLVLKAESLEGKTLYQNRIDVSGKFLFDVNFNLSCQS